MNLAQQHERAIKKLYPFDLTQFAWSGNPVGNNPLAKYEIIFPDLSKIIVIMSWAQRTATQRSKLLTGLNVKIGGLGHVVAHNYVATYGKESHSFYAKDSASSYNWVAKHLDKKHGWNINDF